MLQHRDSHLCHKGKRQAVSRNLSPLPTQRNNSFPWGVSHLPHNQEKHPSKESSEELGHEAQWYAHSHQIALWCKFPSTAAQQDWQQGEKAQGKAVSEWPEIFPELRINPVLISYCGLAPADYHRASWGWLSHRGEDYSAHWVHFWRHHSQEVKYQDTFLK